MEVKYGIKETMEVLSATEAMCEGVLKAAADGKFGVLDARYALEPVKKAVEALKGAKMVPLELKDIDEAELAALVEKTVAVVEKAVLAFEAATAILG